LLAAKITAMDADILLLQEVDTDSKRSAYIDQVQWLLDNTAMNYGVYASMWEVQFVPSDGLGRVNTGAEWSEFLDEAGFVDADYRWFTPHQLGLITARKPS